MIHMKSELASATGKHSAAPPPVPLHLLEPLSPPWHSALETVAAFTFPLL